MSNNKPNDYVTTKSTGDELKSLSDHAVLDDVPTFNHWPIDKDVEDFRKIVYNLRCEGFTSRADAMEYLIERVLYYEKKVGITS